MLSLLHVASRLTRLERRGVLPTLERRRNREKTIGRDGTLVALLFGVRPYFLAWLSLALLLLGLGKMTLAGDQMSISGFVSATDQEATEGYFAVGGDALVVAKQGSGLQRWLKTHSGQRIRVTLEPSGPEN